MKKAELKKNKMQSPDYYLPIMPYMMVEDAPKFIHFLKAVFNAAERIIVPREDGTIRHAEFSIDNAVIMFTDANAEFPVFPCQMFLYHKQVGTFYKLGLENGAESLQEPLERDYGRSAGIKDPFGNVWWLTAPIK